MINVKLLASDHHPTVKGASITMQKVACPTTQLTLDTCVPMRERILPSAKIQCGVQSSGMNLLFAE